MAEPAKPVRILIADDHELVRRGICTILNAEPGWVVCGEATNGREALAMAMELRPDIMILDLGLPEMNGLEVTRRVRGLSIAVLIVTVQSAETTIQDAIDAGASGYVLKADAGRTLVEAIRAILRGEFFYDHGRSAPDIKSLGGSSGGQERTPPLKLAGVTSREREVLHLLAEGWANKEIASALGITTKTVETHRARIMAKLELHSMSELVRYAIRNRIIEP